MAQSTDIVLSDQLGAPFRAELNQILSALGTDNSGNSEPLNTYQFMKWVDTSNATYYYVKERNHDNTAWVTLFRYTVATKIMEAVNNGTDLTTTLALKAPLASPTFTGTVVLPSTTSIGTITNTELGYLDGVTSSIQTQFTGKQETLVSGTNIKTINSNSILGSGNLVVGETTWKANDTRAKTALNASGTAPIYACRAWVNFNGTGTVEIRASGNVSSITDNGVGNYTVNFTTAMQDINYCMIGQTNTSTITGVKAQTYNTSSCVMTTQAYNAVFYDELYVNVSIFR